MKPYGQFLTVLCLSSALVAGDFEDGQAALRSGDAATAVSLIGRSISKRLEGSPEYLRDLYWLARAQYEAGDVAAAQENMAIYWDIQDDLHPSMQGEGSANYNQWIDSEYQRRFGRAPARPVKVAPQPAPVAAPLINTYRPSGAMDLDKLITAELIVGAEDIDTGVDGTVVGLRLGYEWPTANQDRRWFAGGEYGFDSGDADLTWLSAVGAYRWMFDAWGQQFDVGPLASLDYLDSDAGSGFGLRLGGEAAWRYELSDSWFLRAGLGLGYRQVFIDGDDAGGMQYYALIGAHWSMGGGGGSVARNQGAFYQPAPVAGKSTASTPITSAGSSTGATTRVNTSTSAATTSAASSSPAYSSGSSSGGGSYRSSGSSSRSSGGSSFGGTGLTVGYRQIALEGDRNSDGDYEEIWFGWVGGSSTFETQIALGWGTATFDNFERDTTVVDYEMEGLVYDIGFRSHIISVWQRRIALDWELGGGMSMNTGGPSDNDFGLGFHLRGGVGLDIEYDGVGMRAGVAYSVRYYEMTPDEINLDTYDFTTSGVELNVELNF